jgi:hypothetical protein
MNTPIATLEDLKAGPLSVDQLRKQLRVNDAITDINDVATILRDDWESLSKNQIEACRLRVDIARIKLAKVMPDIKAIEHTAGGDTSKVQFVINMGQDGVKTA